MPNLLGPSPFWLLEPLEEPTSPPCPPWAHSLGIIALQQIPRPAIPLPTNHHQRCKRGQEDGGQHTYGDNHHSLHASGWLPPSPSHAQRGLNLRRHKGRGGLGNIVAKESGAVGVLLAGGGGQSREPCPPKSPAETKLPAGGGGHREPGSHSRDPRA